MVSLLFSRRLGPIFTVMALGAFNDNFYKNALIILTTYVLAAQLEMKAEILIAIASAVFIAPFFLFSGFAGMLADRYAKHRMVRVLKVTELLIVIGAGIALASHTPELMLGLLFLMGTQSAFFGPTKYAIIPELVPERELMASNGLIEAGTFVSILLGTVLGGLLVMQPGGIWIVGGILVVAAAIGLMGAWAVPLTMPAVPNLPIPRNPFASLWSMVAAVVQHPEVLRPIIGISWFWAIGALYLTQLPVYTKEVVGGNEQVVTLFFGLFTVGIAVGSLLCHSLTKRFPARHIAPLALLGVCVFGVDLVLSGGKMVPHAPLVGIDGYLTSFVHYRATAGLFLMAVCGGIFTIPLYTRLQLASGGEQRARAIASNNVINAIFIAVASLLSAALYGFGWTVIDVLLAFALANLPVVALLWHRGRAESA